MRLRLKADGRVVEILPDGSERDPVVPAVVRGTAIDRPYATAAAAASNGLAGRFAALTPLTPKFAAPKNDADYARSVRAATKLTQAEFAARIGVPIETVRNWEQGKRAPRGPARALLKVIERAPDLAFAALAARTPA